ncbi:hypothetical protein ABT56_19190 [Photobacterium aquae]|uniref:Uncharacterized protein n=1 Tax=Photobacterium aquae TaxID=1195763 RepID=A0A0J1GVS8_9GAMM|nr:hypothetical protein [Photobacterium aquae]KLV03554.1 hypothetical protein ABT56_19190 [Photobacterium aquae]
MQEFSELTAKQRYQRDYYAKNRDKICENKRDIYAKNKPQKRKDTNSNPKNKILVKSYPTSPCKATSPVRLVDKMPRTARHDLEDIQLAKLLGISVEELVN